MHKIGRNDPCLCGSGKKYKKCCEMQAQSKRFHAEVMTAAPAQTSNGANKISSLFFKSAIPPKLKSQESAENSIQATLDS